MTLTTRPQPPSLRDAMAVAELFVGVFRRDLLAFYPQGQFERSATAPSGRVPPRGPTSSWSRGTTRRPLGRDPSCSGRSTA